MSDKRDKGAGAEALHEASQLKNFISANEKYGDWPRTLWVVKDSSDKSLKREVGDTGKAREGSFPASGLYKGEQGKGLDGATTSIFPPRVASNILAMYAPPWPEARVYDPFAGGGTRALVAAEAGLDYLGVEIRKEEVEHLEALAERHGIVDRVSIIHGDSRKRNGIPDNSRNFLYTCPPYWNLEQYDGGPGDISMMDYEEFVEALGGIIKNSARILEPGSIAAWVVGLHRKPDGELVCMQDDIRRLHREAGFWVKEEVIIHRDNPIALRRVGNFERGHGHLIRVHEYCLIFQRR